MGKFEYSGGGNVRPGKWWDPNELKGLNMAAWEPSMRLGAETPIDGYGRRWAYVQFHRGNLSANAIQDGSPLVFDDDSDYVVTPDYSRGGSNPRLAGVLRINTAISDTPETGWRGVIQVGGTAEDVLVGPSDDFAGNTELGVGSTDGVAAAVTEGSILGKVVSGRRGAGNPVDVQLTLGKTRGMGKPNGETSARPSRTRGGKRASCAVARGAPYYRERP